MTLAEVEARVETIRRLAEPGDTDDQAHAAEDALYSDVLLAIARGWVDDAQALAAAAIKTREIMFFRWIE